MAEYFLGIDPGSVATGYGLIKCAEDYVMVLDSGVIKVPKHQKKARRLFIMGKKISEVIQRYDNISEIYIEDIFLHRNAKATIGLAQVQGAIMGKCYEISGIDPILIPPREVRKVIGGSGSLKKEEIADVVFKMTGHNTGHDRYDETDAIAVGLAGYLRDVKKVEKCQKSKRKQDWSHLEI